MSLVPPLRYQLQADGSLIISPLRPEDAGIYSCGSHRPGHEPQTIQLRVTGFWPILFMPPPRVSQNRIGTEGGTGGGGRGEAGQGAIHPRKKGSSSSLGHFFLSSSSLPMSSLVPRALFHSLLKAHALLLLAL